MLAEQPLVLFSDSFFQTKTIKGWFSDAGVKPNVAIQTEQLSTAQNMIESNLAVGFMFKNLAQKNPSMAPVPLSPPIYVDVSLLRKKDSYVSEGIRKLERYMEESNPFEK
jgi:DNA-binding transcriptional LysR family regulator